MNVVEMPTPRPRVIKLALGELVVAEPALTRLLEERMPAKTAYHLAKLARLAQQELQHFHAKRNDAIKELGIPADDGSITVSAERMPEFSERMRELGAVEVTLDWGPLLISELPTTISPGDVMRLGVLLLDED